MKLLNRQRNAHRFFEGEGDVANPGNQNPNPNPGQADPAPAPAPAPQNPGRTYTQVDFDRLVNTKIADEKRKLTDQNRKTVQQLQDVMKNEQLTVKQRDDLQLQIDDLQATYRTAEEVKKTELEGWQKKYDKETKRLQDESSSWRNRFESNMVSVDINRAAIEHKAVSPEQIEAFLRPRTRVTERMDDSGKPTGEFVTKVKFEDVDAEGKPISLDLDTNAAVKLMSQRPTRFGNLFNNATNGGTGQNPNAAPLNGGRFDLNRMTPQDFKKNRDAIYAEQRRKA